MSKSHDTLNIIYGSRTGNSKAVAVLANDYANYLGIQCQIESMDNMDFETLGDMKNLIIAVSTHGEGEPPVPAEEFHAFIHSKDAPQLNDMQYAVLGLGDSSYRYFAQTGADFDIQLEKLGAKRIREVEKCDIDFEEKSKKWVKNIIDYFAENLPKKEQDKSKKFVFELKLDDSLQFNAYKAKVLNKILLNGENASHPTMNISLSLKGSEIDFHPGDLIGIYASNSKFLVDKLIKALQLDSTMLVGSEENRKMLKEALINDYELTVITPLVLEKYAGLVQNDELQKLLNDQVKLNEYVENSDVLDMVTDFTGDFKPEEFLAILRKLTPRLYSAASYLPNEQEKVDLTIRIINNKHRNREHLGVCSSYVWTRIEEGETVPVFVESNAKFRLPDDNGKDVIMIATGTGIAPFRSFLQYRNIQNASGRNWLFFGERNSSTDFFYKNEMLDYQQKGLLTHIETAFSRDSENKHYIYHRLLEKGDKVYQWIKDGASIYICGNKRTMANDVRNALSEIIRINENLTQKQTDEYIKKLRLEKRLQEDVY
jgi:sulfite reductase (NADPH) flavoprotein alpha-component